MTKASRIVLACVLMALVGACAEQAARSDAASETLVCNHRNRGAFECDNRMPKRPDQAAPGDKSRTD